VLCLAVYTRFQAPAFCLYALRCDLRSRCRDAHLNRGLAPEGEILFATKTLPGFRPAGQPHGCSNSLQANLCSASAIAPALLYLLHPCSRKESIQKKGGPLPLLSCAPRFHRALPRPYGQSHSAPSLCLALRVLRMQIGCPADLSRRKLRCSARQTGLRPCHSKSLLLNRYCLTGRMILTNRGLL